jgi:hypothetical protein
MDALDTGIAGKPFLTSLEEHPGYSAVFQPNRLTFGFIAPLEGYPNAPWPTLKNHAEAVRKVEALGFAAIWLRDVPFYDPSFGDVGQVIDPMVYAGWVAAQTTRIAIGTAGIVLPLRDPLAVAKQATSIDRLSGGRFLLGLSTGDRPSEYAAFGSDLASRAERYRDARKYRWLGLAPEQPQAPGAWRLAEVIAGWRATGNGAFRPYGYGAMFELLADPDAPVEFGMGGMRGGRKALIEHWERQREEGVNHVALNPKPFRRPFIEVAEELAEYVLPEFAE